MFQKRRLLFENHVDTHDRRENELANRIVCPNTVRYFEHVVIGACKEFLSDTSPFLRDMRKFDVVMNEPKIPSCPFSSQATQRAAVRVEYIKSAADGKEFLIKSADDSLVFVVHLYVGQEYGNPSRNPNQLLSIGSSDLNIEGCIPFEIRKP